MRKMNVKEMLIVGGAIIVLTLGLNTKDQKVHSEMSVIAHQVQKAGNVWYVDDNILDKAFKQGVWNPKPGDQIELEINRKGYIIGWKVKRMKFLP